jgi:hypothetical protein
MKYGPVARKYQQKVCFGAPQRRGTRPIKEVGKETIPRFAGCVSNMVKNGLDNVVEGVLYYEHENSKRQTKSGYQKVRDKHVPAGD